MSEQVDVWRAMREDQAARRAASGVPCPLCLEKLPKASPAILLPQQRCRIHNYRDPRALAEDRR